MATILVGTGFRRVSLERALSSSSAGDLLRFQPGVYEIPSINVKNLRFQGEGDPNEVIIRSRVDVTGTLSAANLTIEAPHYSNAITMRGAHSSLSLEGVLVKGDPTRKYPAIYCSEGKLELVRTTVQAADKTTRSICTEKGAKLLARSSALGYVQVSQTRVQLENVIMSTLWARNGSHVTCETSMALHPDAQMRAFRIENESVLTCRSMQIRTPEVQALCDGSFVEIDALDLVDCEELAVYRKGVSTIRIPSAQLRTIDAEAAPKLPPQPKTVVWKREDARSAQKVMDTLNGGDTLVLESGDYYLDDYENQSIFFNANINIRNSGAPQESVLHGNLIVSSEVSVSLADFTLAATPGHNALNISSKANVSLSNIVMENEAGDEFPALCANDATVTMSHCVMTADSGIPTTNVYLTNNAQTTAQASELGWFIADNQAHAQINNCSGLQIQVNEAAKVTATGALTIRQNTADRRELVSNSGSELRVESITLEGQYSECSVGRALLAIDEVSAPDEATLMLFTEDDAQYSVPDLFQISTPDTPTEPEVEPETAPVPPEFPESEGALTDPLKQINELIGLTQSKRASISF